MKEREKDNRKKRISVIIDNYNYGKFLSECIQSVLSQTYSNWELILVDDGSADSSREIILDYCKQYPDRITAVYKPNGGQGSAFNAGFSLAKGDIIAFLDSDDYWYPQKLEEVVRLHNTCEMAGHNQSAGGVFGDTSFHYLIQEDKSQYYLKKYGFIWFFNTTTSALSFSRRLLEKIFPIPEEVTRICADTYVSLLGVYYKGLHYVDEKLGCYRLHDKNQYRENVTWEHKREDILYPIFQAANEHLVMRGETPIPVMNFSLLRELHEKEENFIIEKAGYVVYGTGAVAKRITSYILFCGGNIFAYCDSNREKWGKNFLGRCILPPEQLKAGRVQFYKIVIASTWVGEISKTLERLGLKRGDDYIYSEIGFWQDVTD